MSTDDLTAEVAQLRLELAALKRRLDFESPVRDAAEADLRDRVTALEQRLMLTRTTA